MSDCDIRLVPDFGTGNLGPWSIEAFGLQAVAEASVKGLHIQRQQKNISHKSNRLTKGIVFQQACPWLKHHYHAGRSVYRQASVIEIGRRTYGRPGRRGEDGPAEAGRDEVCYHLDKYSP